MTTISWGSYLDYEGPFYRGGIKFVAPTSPDFLDKCLLTLTATEGGAYDAVNMYDRCILSVGLIQWCEAFPQCSVSTILGKCAEADQFMFSAKMRQFPGSAEFKKNGAGIWRFYWKGVEVTNQAMQQGLFFGKPGLGKKGTWDTEDKAYAKNVAGWFANFWDVPLFQRVQATFTKAKIPNFAMKEAKEILFSDSSIKAQEGWQGALRAAFYSFAGNIPVVANSSMKKAAANPEWATADWADRFRIGLQAMTFSPGITIYPGRYNKIAPVLKSQFGVDIPLTAEDLSGWKDAPAEYDLSEDEKSIQQTLNNVYDTVVSGLCEVPFADAILSCTCDK